MDALHVQLTYLNKLIEEAEDNVAASHGSVMAITWNITANYLRRKHLDLTTTIALEQMERNR